MKVVPIADCTDTPARLRELADKIETSGSSQVTVTIIVGSDVYCWGPLTDQRAAEAAIFDMTFGIHKLMGLPVKRALERDGDY